jgi:hypothetical protein
VKSESDVVFQIFNILDATYCTLALCLRADAQCEVLTMEFLINILLVLNITLGMALFVIKMAQLDRRHARRIRAQEDYKSYFRDGR